MCCAPGPVFDGTKGVGSRFPFLRSRTCFGRYRGRRVPFSSFAFLDPFSAIPRVSGPVFVFCAPVPVFSGTEGVKSCFTLPDLFWAVQRASGSVFMFCAPGPVFGGTERVGSRFSVLRSLTCLRRYGGRRVLPSCFALPDPFWAAPRAPRLIFLFSAPEPIFGGTEGVGPVFMFCAPGTIFGGTECAASRFHVLRSQTYFGRHRGRQIPFSCFALVYPWKISRIKQLNN
jgi:hypothetical protein